MLDTNESQGEVLTHNSKENLAMMFYCFVLSFDAMITFMTVYFYWGYVSDGREQYYGLAFSAYFVGTMIASPVLGLLAQKRSLWEAATVSLILCIIGNAMYFCSDIPDPGAITGICLFVFGRLVEGMGASGVTLSLVYLINISDSSERLGAMNRFRAWQFWGKFFGPCLGTLYLYCPSVEVGGIPLNAATYAPLTTIFLCVIAIPVVVIFCRELQMKKVIEKIPIWKDSEAQQMCKDVLKLFVVYIVSLMSLWMVFAQIMPIGVIFFQIAEENPSNIWVIYLPPMIGAILGMILTKRVIVPMKLTDASVLLGSSAVVTISLISFIQFKSKEPAWIYFVGCTLLFLSFGILSTAFRSIYSQTVGNSRHLSVMMSLLFTGAAVGQIIGPIISSAFVSVTCTGEESGEWSFESCTMSGLNVGVVISIVAMALSTIYTAIIIYVVGIPSLKMGTGEYLPIEDEATDSPFHAPNSPYGMN